MRLTPIIVCGVLVLATTVLVKHYSWDPLLAGITAGCCAIGFALAILLVILLLVDAAERRELWGVVWRTARDDLKEIFDVLRFRR